MANRREEWREQRAGKVEEAGAFGLLFASSPAEAKCMQTLRRFIRVRGYLSATERGILLISFAFLIRGGGDLLVLSSFTTYSASRREQILASTFVH